MIHHNLQILLLGKVDELFRLRHAARKWLFNEHVLAIEQGILRHVEVGPDRGNDRDCIHIRRSHKFVVSGINRYPGIGGLNPLPGRRTLVANPHHLATLQPAEVPNDVRSPIAVPNYTNFKHRNSP